MPWIDHCSLTAIQTGWHKEPENCVLIQIVDPNMEFPEPLYKGLFEEIFQFKFLDLEDNSPMCISDTQAEDLATILEAAKDNGNNVLVHCVMGVCRSGGVAQAGEAMGFLYTNPPYCNPNLLVKHKIINSLLNRGYDGFFDTTD